MIEQILIISGLFTLSVGTLGLIRLEGTLNRMHATSKASTLGVGFIVVATAISFYPEDVYLTALMVLMFLFMTAPTGAHMIARSDYRREIKQRNKKDRGRPLREFLKN